MRIVAGEFRGRTIDAPEGDGTRPTTDRVREALMSSLYSMLGGFEDQSVLDAFAGSGALGLEALSRGARHADFFESSKAAYRTLRANISACRVGSERASAYNADVLRAFAATEGAVRSASGAPYTLVFMDPPYALGARAAASFADGLQNAGALADDAVIVYEHDWKFARDVSEAFGGWDIMSDRKYGKTGIALLRIREEGVQA